jgi:hypothetical protein
MHRSDTILDAELRNVMVKWARIFLRDGIEYNNSMPISTGDAKPIAQAVRQVPYAMSERLESANVHRHG